jgi:hypothetical protein
VKASAINPSSRALVVAAGLAVALAAAGTAHAQAPAAFLDPSLKPEARAAALVSAMTLEEKAGQLKHAAPAIPRLSVPAYNWWSEGLHGVARAGEATVFPQAIGMAATWDAPMIHGVADTIATEFRAKYVEKARPRRRLGPVSRPDGLVAQHQHLPRPALGPGPGDLGRGPAPDRRAGRGLRHRPAGRRPDLLQDRRHGQALRRP